MREDIDEVKEDLATLEPRVKTVEEKLANLLAKRVTNDVFLSSTEPSDLPSGKEEIVHTWTVPAGETLDVAASFDVSKDSIDGFGVIARLWS